jgi:hypothetical protein
VTPAKHGPGASVPAARVSGPAPETRRALLHCARGCGWTRHDFVGRQPVRVLENGFPTGKLILEQLMFADAAGHERVWGNEGSQQ